MPIQTRLILASLAIIVVTALPASAQGVQTRILQGTARDAAGLVLPGVSVTVTSPALQGPRLTVTDSNGVYVLRG